MSEQNAFRSIGVAIVVAGVSLPLVGAWVAERDLRSLAVFPPPLDVPAEYPRWSWIAFALVVGPLVAIALSWLVARTANNAGALNSRAVRAAGRRTFPWWGWFALAWTLAWWALAWTRFDWFAPLQLYTFFPLWLGFIVAVNASTVQRGGRCTMRAEPMRWLTLFALSAAFWWWFEWLNRFVRNWHYLGVEEFGPLGYAANASLCFSTVLPAVLAVREWLATFPAFVRTTAAGPAWRWLGTEPQPGSPARPHAAGSPRPRLVALGLLAAGAIGLACAGAWPQRFYAVLWIAPLALAFGAGMLRRASGPWNEVARGDWRRAAAWAVAALGCGFFWEMWNWQSAAKWIYTVPFVERWHVFEMPLLGYAGYLGFGLECALVVEWVIGRSDQDARRSAKSPTWPTASPAHFRSL